MKIVNMMAAERGTYVQQKSNIKYKEIVVMWVHVDLEDELNRECVIGATCHDMVALSNPAVVETTVMRAVARMATCEYITAASR